MTQYRHRYSTECPRCKADLTANDSIVMHFIVADRPGEAATCLDRDGWLLDIDQVIAQGHHSGTDCRGCGETLDGHEITDDVSHRRDAKANSRETRRVEYYRLWPGNSGDGGTWDTDFIDVSADTPDDRLDEAVRQAAQKIKWREEPPVIVGCYCDASDEEEGDVPQQIRAECHSDDRVYAAEFNALAWFEQAEDSEILKLAEEDWGDGYAADEVGMFMADLVPDVQKMFDYLEHYNQAPRKVSAGSARSTRTMPWRG